MKRLFIALLCFAMLTGCQATPAPASSSASPASSAASEASKDESIEEPTEAPSEDDSWQYILDKGELVIGLDDTFAPMGFRDEANNLIGFDIDLATAVCEYLGVEAKFQPIDWDAKEMELSTKKIDCIWNGMSITPERQQSMSLTRGYLNNRIIIMSVPGVEVNSKEDLAGLSVGTQAKSSALEMVQGDPIYSELKDFHEYRTYDEVIMDMDAGRIQVMIVDEVLGMYKNSKRDSSFVVSEVDFGDDFYAVGFRKEDLELTAKVQEAIDALIANGKAAEISDAWFGTDIVLKP